MHTSKLTVLSNCICICMIVTAGTLRFGTDYIVYPFSKNLMIFVCYTIAILLWMRQNYRRIIQTEVQMYLKWMGFHMLILMGIRTVKYLFIADGHFLGRYMWYSYYIIMLNMAFFQLMAVLHIGKKEGESISKRWKLLYVPTAVLWFLILTNDRNQLAFSFRFGVNYWSDHYMKYGLLFYITYFYIAGLFLSSIIFTMVRCSVTERRRYFWVALLPLLIGVGYYLGTIRKEWDIFRLSQIFLMPEMVCVIFGIFIEGLIVMHLLPSNDSYERFWDLSSIRGGIVDQNGVIQFQSANGISVTAEQIRESGKNTVFLNENTILQKSPIRGGSSYWIRDITKLNQLNSELQKLGDLILEENELIKAENQIRESRTAIEQKARLYREIAKALKPQLETLKSLLETLPKEELLFQKEMKKACIYNVYLKRYSNLLILSEHAEQISCEELRLAFSESLEYIELYGAETYMSWNAEGDLPVSKALTVYRVLEELLEAYLVSMTSLLIEVITVRKSIKVSFQIARSESISNRVDFTDLLNQPDGALSIQYEREEETDYITVTVRYGGCGYDGI